jgi:hypothetical protein
MQKAQSKEQRVESSEQIVATKSKEAWKMKSKIQICTAFRSTSKNTHETPQSTENEPSQKKPWCRCLVFDTYFGSALENPHFWSSEIRRPISGWQLVSLAAA